LNYYQDLLSKPIPDHKEVISRIIQHIPKLVMEEHKATLHILITKDEVELIINFTLAAKSPSPDGFTLDFFHYCWYFLKYEIWKPVEESHKTLGVILSLNATLFTLIRK
jgi:hypothetical protein